MVEAARLPRQNHTQHAWANDMKMLIIEDEPQTARYIFDGLKQAGHEPAIASDGQEGLKLAAIEPFDVVIVDRMLPTLDGVSIVQSLRKIGVATPILFVTSLGGIDDRIEGLEAGGDDYLVKPFDRAELVARVNALGRRRGLNREDTTLRAGRVQINLLTREVHCGEKLIDLQPREFKLLEVLLRHKNQLVTKAMLLERVWDLHFDPKTSIVETHLSRLRAKLDPLLEAPLVRNVRGAGYCIDDPA